MTVRIQAIINDDELEKAINDYQAEGKKINALVKALLDNYFTGDEFSISESIMLQYLASDDLIEKLLLPQKVIFDKEGKKGYYRQDLIYCKGEKIAEFEFDYDDGADEFGLELNFVHKELKHLNITPANHKLQAKLKHIKEQYADYVLWCYCESLPDAQQVGFMTRLVPALKQRYFDKGV